MTANKLKVQYVLAWLLVAALLWMYFDKCHISSSPKLRIFNFLLPRDGKAGDVREIFLKNNNNSWSETKNVVANRTVGKHVHVNGVKYKDYYYDVCMNAQPDGFVSPKIAKGNKRAFDILTNESKYLRGLCRKEDTPRAEALYNGLCLGSSCNCIGRGGEGNKWPPESRQCFLNHFNQPPYANYSDPPQVVQPGKHEKNKNFCFDKGFNGHGIRNVSIGRQLFTDNFLISSMTPGIKRIYSTAKWANTIRIPDGIGEIGGSLVWNNQTNRFRIYLKPHLSYMESSNGLDWLMPVLTNARLPQRDGSAVWLDPFETDKTKMYKAAAYKRGKIYHWTSPDGNNFTEHPASQKGFFQDASLLSMNPFRRKWLYFVKANYMTQVRTQLYSEVDIEDFGEFNFGPGYCPLSGKWFGEDFRKNPYSIWKGLGCLVEPPSDTYQPNRFQSPVFSCADSADADFDNDYLDSYCARDFYIPKRLTDIYFSVAFAYESIMVLLMPIHSKWNSKAPKIHFPHLGWSRDGFHYSRVPPVKGQTKRPRHGYIDVSSIPSNWTKDRTFIEWKPIGNSFLVMGDSLYVYVGHYWLNKGYIENFALVEAAFPVYARIRSFYERLQLEQAPGFDADSGKGAQIKNSDFVN